jgi:hypothetical protein
MREIKPARERIYAVSKDNNLPIKASVTLSRRVREAEADLRIEDGRADLILRRHSTYFTYSLVALNTVSTLVILFFIGFGVMALPNAVLLTLIGETMAHIGAVFITTNRHLFPPR